MAGIRNHSIKLMTSKHKQTKISPRQKVFVGMSGGVDSSVSAALLKDEGYEVTGVFIKTWQPEGFPCSWKDERRDAMRVCAELEIPFLTLDLEKEYKKDVVDYMIAEYSKGKTPNPDVMCNKHIKFGAFYDWAIDNGADYIATGHYSRIGMRQIPNHKYQIPNKSQIENLKSSEKEYELLKGIDEEKDQSYFLWQIRREQLAHVIFPIGEYKKSEVRKLAEKFNLSTAGKKDSQGICFIGKLDMKDFLSQYLNPKRGIVLNMAGEQVGTHNGAILYTIGERRGFEITEKNPHTPPMYVVSKDIDANTITVSESESNIFEKSLNNTKVDICSANWISGEPFPAREYSVRFRYRQKLLRCNVQKEGDCWAIKLLGESVACAPGQSAVIYDKDTCLGGGVIM